VETTMSLNSKAMSSVSRRVCFTMRLKPHLVEKYLAVHQNVWTEMLEALRETGWSNYSLFIDRDEGLVVGYLETDDFDRALKAMAARPVNDRWQAGMAEFFAEGIPPDQTLKRLAEYFHLD
jgi:L-rhamnose mutarotase